MPMTPFKPQHLAKLVLGYLAEEQLMTVYDEFLQTSPYLDAFQNEYDRVFMTSLRSIVADYWAVKIYVESCQPVTLRRALLRCSNTLDIIKCLITMVDVKRIKQQETRNTDRKSQNEVSLCDSSQCLRSGGCACKNSPSHADSGVETTSLADLPGGSKDNRRQTHIKAAETEAVVSDDATNNASSQEKRLPDLNLEQGNVYIEHTSATNMAELYGGTPTYHHLRSQSYHTQTVQDTTPPQHIVAVSSATIEPYSHAAEVSLHYDSAYVPKTIQDSKVKILSDVRMENHPTNLPPVLKNVSTPLVQMRTILINGTPAYRAKQTDANFTKDEIMAMPTIILVPPTTSSQKSGAKNVVSITQSSAQSFEPLTIDICSPDHKRMPQDHHPNQAFMVNKNVVDNAKYVNVTSIDTKQGPTTGLVKTIDVLKPSASLPKSAILESNDNISTPNVCPPTRKSSSTPRRNSTHIRVLDFATPRRILNETINELNQEDQTKNVAVKTENSVNVTNQQINNVDNDQNVNPKSNRLNNSNPPVRKSKNWDDDLRALLANQATLEPSSPKKSKKRKSKTNDSSANDDKTESKNSARRKNNKKNKSKGLHEELEVIDEVVAGISMQPPVKPTINVIAGDQCTTTNTHNDNNEKEVIDVTGDTPDTERNSLQNLIGAKLNLSDLLETPYKQALYDIQMETPRFFGSQLGVSGTPISDIKIVNIPTPKFLDTPKVASPASYASRATDYSSGGSYYKPEEHYIPVLENTKPDVKENTNKNERSQKPSKSNIKDKTKQKRKSNKDSSPKPETKEKQIEKDSEIDSVKSVAKIKNSKTRPVRKCRTKNVPNYKNPLNKSKNQEDTLDSISSYSDDVSIDDKNSNNNKKESNVSKCESGKKSVGRPRKTPVRKDNLKSVIKVKPKRPSPKKSRSVQKLSKSPAKSPLKKYIVGSLAVQPVLTKSRRKSSTPRKLDCVDAINSNKYGCSSPETPHRKKLADQLLGHESESENLQLCWSDETSQEPKNTKNITKSPGETEDITKIQEYIQSTISKTVTDETDNRLPIDLIKRGFDVETAKQIERDLLNSPLKPELNMNDLSPKVILKPASSESKPIANEIQNPKKVAESDTSAVLQINEDDEDVDEIEFSVIECDESKENFITIRHDKTYVSKDPVRLKDKFTMEIEIDEDKPIRLIAEACVTILEMDPEELLSSSYNKELRAAVRSISIDEKDEANNLDTPMKNSLRAQCYELFDSTLTSIDTPIKSNTTIRERHEVTTSEALEEVVIVESNLIATNSGTILREKLDMKRKRQSGSTSDESINEKKKKKTKTEAQYLLNSEKIQNMDIESVLSRLHGPENSQS